MVNWDKFGEFARDKKDTDKPNLPAAVLLGAVAANIGQQTVRSGIPRVLGVRLESHSTSNKAAAEILKNGGLLDPNKSGTQAIQGINVVLKDNPLREQYYNQAKAKVYITGVRPDSKLIPTLGGLGVGVHPTKISLLEQLAYRKQQRAGYRAQADLDWDKIKADPNPKKALQFARITGLLEAKLKPWKGRSLYVGGSDDFFMQNFKPDFDDPMAQYSEKPVKVYGNRFAAAKAAIEREGLGNLMKANRSRVAAGAAILIGGGLTTAALAKAAVDAARGDGTVKGYKRRTKTGRVAMVRSFKRQLPAGAS